MRDADIVICEEDNLHWEGKQTRKVGRKSDEVTYCKMEQLCQLLNNLGYNPSAQRKSSASRLKELENNLNGGTLCRKRMN